MLRTFKLSNFGYVQSLKTKTFFLILNLIKTCKHLKMIEKKDITLGLAIFPLLGLIERSLSKVSFPS